MSSIAQPSPLANTFGRLTWLSRLDGGLLAALAVVAGFGLVVLYSASEASTATLLRQCVRLGVGVVAMLIIARFSPGTLRIWTPWLFLGSVILLALIPWFGVGRGAQRWLDFGFVRFQPSELLKLTVPMMLAWYFHDRVLPPRMRDLLVCAVLIAVPTGLIAIQPDLGTSLLVAAAGLFTIFLAGIGWRTLLGLLGAALASTPVLWHFMRDYQKSRVLTMLNPDADPLGRGWNIIQSKIAVGSGGLIGKGWQNGSQSHLEFLPERSTDFILAVLAEEFGFAGVLILLGLYLFIVGRGLAIGVAARETYSRLLAGSLSLTFFVYVAVNGGMITGLLPVVGIPLPLVSYGGTSIVTLLVGFGILLSIHSHRRFIEK